MPGAKRMEPKEVSVGRRAESDACRKRLARAAKAYRELFNLLEDFAPRWYTKAHHRRAEARFRDLENSRQVALTEAARPQKAC